MTDRIVRSPSLQIEQRILRWPDEDFTVELDVPEVIGPQLAPRLQRRRDVEWLGIIRRAKGHRGALGRLRATGALVEVFGRSISTLRPQIAAAVSAVLDEEIKTLLQELGGSETRDSRHPDPLRT
jgi:hypothetical protein